MATNGILDKRSSLIGAAIGLLVGGLAGFAMAQNVDGTAPTATAAAPAQSTPAHLVPGPPGSDGVPTPPPVTHAHPSFAQQGEDLVMVEMLRHVGVRTPTYLDIGAHDPFIGSNTYIFYAYGGRGVLVEPNPHYVAKLRQARPGDVVLEVGVGIDEQPEADYYLIDGDGQLNTFSKEQADSLVRVHRRVVQGVIKRKLVPINQILEEHFKDRAPDVLSIDVEGLDFAILKTLDWKRRRPKVVCVETSKIETGELSTEILDLMRANGYSVRGGSYVNTIFLDDEAAKRYEAERAAKNDAGASARADGGAP